MDHLQGVHAPKTPTLVSSLSLWTHSTALTPQHLGSAGRHGALDSLCPWPGLRESQPQPRLHQRVAPSQAYAFLDHAK